MKQNVREFSCGAACIYTVDHDLGDLAGQLKQQLAKQETEFALLFFSKEFFPVDTVLNLMKEHAPGLEYAACTTAGEITPMGLSEGELVIILFPKKYFSISYCDVGGTDKNYLSDITKKIGKLKEDAKEASAREAEEQSIFAMCFLDGMSYEEEVITAALHWALDDIPLLGGSAGDDMNFKETHLIVNGQVLESRAFVLIMRSNLPIKIFKTENFVPTENKLVVTHSDPDQRIVYEFNGGPAGEVYAQLIGANPEDLNPQSFASHPLVVRVGGEYYCRSIQRINEDGSLTFFCAIDDGIVLTIAKPTGMGQTTSDTMQDLKDSLGEVDFILGFDCVLRQVDARNRQITRKISDIYRQNNLVGFNTYGEQYQSMHLNQTLTGVAFGLPETNK